MRIILEMLCLFVLMVFGGNFFMIFLLFKSAVKLLFLRVFSLFFKTKECATKQAQICADIAAIFPVSNIKSLDEAVEFIDAAFVMYDANGNLITCNKHFRDMYQYSKEEVKTGTHFRDLGFIDIERGNVVVGDELGADYLRRKAEYRKDPKGVFIIQLSDGRWIMTRDRRTLNGCLVSIQTDITDIKNTENALLIAKEEAELADRAKSDFLANMSHELRTPLNSIIGFSSILETQILTSDNKETLQEYAQNINSSGEYLLKVINDILDMAKVEAGRIELTEYSLDISFVLQSCINMLRVRADTNDIMFELNMADDLPNLYADETRIKQIMTNLMSNAIKFSDAGDKVRVSAKISDQGGAVLTVVDEGIGMSDDDLLVAMDKFGQVSSSYTRNHEGTGLGLNLVQSLVKAHDAKFTLTSEPGVGTTAEIRFPADRSVSLAKAV